MSTARVPMASRAKATKEGVKPLGVTRVLIGGDQPLYLSALAHLIDERSNLDLAGEVSSDKIAPAFTELKPDVAVLGPFNPERMREAEILSNAMERIRVVFVAGEPEPTIYDAIGAGAMGYLTTAATSHEVHEILEGVAVGQYRFSSHAQDALLRRLGDAAVDHRRLSSEEQDAIGREVHERVRAARPHITPREREVLRLMTEDLTSVQIGERLYITASTVKTHQRKIYRKLGARNGNAAVAAAVRHWFI